MIKDILYILVTSISFVWFIYMSVKTLKIWTEKNEGKLCFKIVATIGVVLSLLQAVDVVYYALQREWYSMEMSMVMPIVFVIISYVISRS